MKPSLREIEGAVEERRKDIVRFAVDLIRLPTVNQPPRGEEARGQYFLSDALPDVNFDIDMFDCIDVDGFKEHPLFWPGRELEGRPNLVATWKGNDKGRSILFSGHIDVVPPSPMPWDHGDPFIPRLEEGKLFGRGAKDMKGGMTAAFMAIQVLFDIGFRPRGDVIFESVVDEEFAGAHGTLACRLRGYKADLCINPEPTGMSICPATLGAKLFNVTVPGTAGLPFPKHNLYNPIWGLAKIVGILREFETEWNRRFQGDPWFREHRIPLHCVLWQIKAGEFYPQEQMSVPKDGRISVIAQTPPRVKESDFDAFFRKFFFSKIDSETELHLHQPVVEKTHRYMYPAYLPFDHHVVKSLSQVFRECTGKHPQITILPSSCDLFLFKHCDSGPAVCLGPYGENSHASNEWVLIEDVVQLTKIFAYLITKWAG